MSLERKNVRALSLIGGTIATFIGLFLLWLGISGLCNTKLYIDMARQFSKSHLESSAKSMLFLGIINAIAGSAIIFSNFKNNDDNKDDND